MVFLPSRTSQATILPHRKAVET